MNLHIIKNEKGIALLFTLGILSVLLILALAFATTSITERKAAGNNAELTASRLLAESAVQRAIAALRYYDANWPTAAYDKIVSREKNDAFTSEPTRPLNTETFDYLWRLETIIDGVSYCTWDPTTYDKTKDVNWVYIHDTSDPDSKILGRLAYYVVASGGKLDPSMCVSHNAGTAPLPGKTSLPDGTAVDEGAVTEVRNGKYVCEINVKNLDNNVSGYLTSGAGGVLQKMSTDGVAGGLLPEGVPNVDGRWADFDTFVNTLGISNNKKPKFNEWFIVSSSSQDDERFWIDNNNNGLQDAGEWYHRFDISRTDWDTNAALKGVPGVATLTGAPSIYAPNIFTDVAAVGNAIQWIANFGKNNAGADDVAYKGNYGSVADRRKQIAANLIDYCDADTKATTDDENNPKYTGNDRTPYINEVRLHFDGRISATPPDGFGNSIYTPVVRLVEVYVELCDIYGVPTLPPNPTYTASVYVEGSYDWGPPLAGHTVNFGSAAVAITTVGITTTGSKGYIANVSVCNLPLPPIVPPLSETFASGSTEQFVKNLKITTLKVKLVGPDRDPTQNKYLGANVFADFSYIEPNGTAETYDVSTDGTPGNRHVSYQVNGDPRQNLFATDWLAPVNNVAICGTPTDKNTGCDPTGGGKDVELLTALDTGTFSISTAYIRNGSMMSPWELGFIHRGVKWETINLKKYNNDDDDLGTPGGTNEFGVSPNMGGRAYDKGDANILDQIKMTHDTNQGYGKVNVRACSVPSLSALLGYINVGSTMVNPSDAPGAPGVSLNYNNQVMKIANDINGSNKRPFITRAQIVNATDSSNTLVLSGGLYGLTQNKDALQEEIIGKFINLTKATIADEFTIIAIAQTIKDVGGKSGASIVINKDINGDSDVSDTNLDGTAADPGYFWNGSVSTAAALPGLVDETITGCKIGQYDLGADEILSEQKVLCVVRKTSAGKWEILRYEYVE